MTARPAPTPEKLPALVQPVLEFFGKQSCYDFLPPSSQVLALDIDLPLRHAFCVVTEHNSTFATLWDSQSQKLCGMMTVTDYVKIVLSMMNEPEKMEAYWNSPIRAWKDERPDHGRPRDTIIQVDVEDSLLSAIHLLYTHNVHRVPVTHDGNLLYVISHLPLLSYMVSSEEGMNSDLFSFTIQELEIGTCNEIASATEDFTIGELLQMSMERGISTIPIVDPQTKKTH
eukprot:TRINITY_DN67522_c7_g3_i1.p1 TRINITY_DN67522_c7_g3~~TRINITY_DN67522_c7_g3_i1.p1  ORF type:complete len:228 (+),score=2.19 TRINITY_DN67522_c7_g3_i1:41-724(+)